MPSYAIVGNSITNGQTLQSQTTASTPGTPSLSDARTGTGTASLSINNNTNAIGDYFYVGKYTTFTDVREWFAEFTTGPSVIGSGETVKQAEIKVRQAADVFQNMTDPLEVYAYDFGSSMTTAAWRTPTWLSSATLLATADPSKWNTNFTVDHILRSTSSFAGAVSTTGKTRLVITTKNQRTNSALAGVLNLSSGAPILYVTTDTTPYVKEQVWKAGNLGTTNPTVARADYTNAPIAGDKLVAIVMVANNDSNAFTSITTPSGWTLGSSDVNTTDHSGMGIYKRTASGDSSDDVQFLTNVSTSSTAGVVHVVVYNMGQVSSVTLGTPVDTTGTTSTTGSLGSAGDLLVNAYFNFQNNNNPVNDPSVPTGQTERDRIRHALNADVISFALAEELLDNSTHTPGTRSSTISAANTRFFGVNFVATGTGGGGSTSKYGWGLMVA